MKALNVLCLRIILLSIGLVAYNISWGGGALPAAPASNNGVYTELFGGAAWTHPNRQSTNVTLVQPLVSNRYELNNSVSASGPVVGLDVGYVWRNIGQHPLSVSLGLDLFYTRSLSKAGVVRPLYWINPNFDPLYFHYAVSSVPLLILSRLGYTIHHWMPYVLVGLGVSWNRASDYQETPVDPSGGGLAMRSPFNAHTTSDFAYTAGAGIACALNETTELGLEYRYMNYGNARLGTSPGQTTNYTLSLGNQASHMVLLRLSEQWVS